MRFTRINRLKRTAEEVPAWPVTRECPDCLLDVHLKAKRCPSCTLKLKGA